jgi:Spy/CpxP family protein refolding chaperone
MKRNQTAAIFLGILLFCAGALAGALAERYFTASVVNAKTAEDFRQHYTSEMKSRLKLTPQQINQLDIILDETKAKYRAVRDQYRPAMVEIKKEQISRVKSILTPQQVGAYDQLLAEREQRYKAQQERDRQEDLKREAEHRARAGR